MVKIMENPIKMDDLGGKPTISVQLPEARGSHRKNEQTHGAFLSKTWLGEWQGMAARRDI